MFGQVVTQQLMLASTKQIRAGFAVRWLKPIFLCVFLPGLPHPDSASFIKKNEAIDDYSAFGHNDATVIAEKVLLGGLDVVVSIVPLLMQSFEYLVFSITIAGGTVLTGAVHAKWRRDGLAPVGRTLDLVGVSAVGFGPSNRAFPGVLRVQPRSQNARAVPPNCPACLVPDLPCITSIGWRG